MVTWSFVALGCVFAYLQIGYWLGRLHWWSWRARSRPARAFRAVLFPVTTVLALLDSPLRSHETPHVGGFEADDKRAYLGIKAATWPLSLAFSLVMFSLVVAAAVLAGCLYGSWKALVFCARHLARFVAGLWFCMTEGPAALVARLAGKGTRVLPAPEPPAEVADEDDRPTLPSVPSRDIERAGRYRALVQKKAEVEAELSRLEAEDAADHPDAFREVPAELRLKG